MPFKRKKSIVPKYTKKKRTSVYKRPIFQSKYKTFSPREYTTFPQFMRTYMIYNQFANINLVGGAGVVNVWRGNSIVDPDQGAGTLACLWYQTIDDIYGKYAVVGSKIEVEFINSDLVPLTCYVFPYISSTITDLNFDIVSAMPNAKTTFVPTAAGGGIRKITNSMLTKNLLNLNPFADDQVQATMGTNPPVQWYWMVQSRASDRATNGGLSLNIKITYDCLFSSRKTIGYA